MVNKWQKMQRLMSLKSMETDAEVAMTYLLNIKNQRVDKTDWV